MTPASADGSDRSTADGREARPRFRSATRAPRMAQSMPSLGVHLLGACVSALLLSACSPTSTTPAATAFAAAPAASAAKPHFKACELVTAAEMSAILGATVTAAPNERSPSDTACTYTPAGASAPVLGIRVTDGEGPVAMSAAGLAAGATPAGMVDPLQGVGEQAVHVQAGQMVMINTGDDRMEIDYGDTANPLPKVRRIYEIARPRM
jgi:hypothetical protein